MTEQHMRQVVIDVLRPLDPISVENSAYPGTPDVNYVEGWIELKYAEAWPVRGGILRIDHFTPQQRVWLTKRARRGGNVFLLLQVGQQWLLFDGQTGAQRVGYEAREALEAVALRNWPKGLNKMELREYLREQNT